MPILDLSEFPALKHARWNLFGYPEDNPARNLQQRQLAQATQRTQKVQRQEEPEPAVLVPWEQVNVKSPPVDISVLK